MQLIDNNRVERGKIIIRFGPAQHQCQLLGRGQQNIGRVLLLTGFAILRRVTAARLNADIQFQFIDRLHQIALNIDSQGL